MKVPFLPLKLELTIREKARKVRKCPALPGGHGLFYLNMV